jgi:hypothetical protein
LPVGECSDLSGQSSHRGHTDIYGKKQVNLDNCVHGGVLREASDYFDKSIKINLLSFVRGLGTISANIGKACCALLIKLMDGEKGYVTREIFCRPYCRDSHHGTARLDDSVGATLGSFSGSFPLAYF